jgi:hypothetical protein
VSNEAWVVTVYRIYKFADRGVVMGGALNTAIIHLSPTHLEAYTLLNIVTALFIRFRITEMCFCIKKSVLQVVSRCTWF